MPTNKPKVQTLLTTKYFNKFKVIAKKEERSESKMAAIMIEKYIDEYESKYGEIKVQNINIEDNHGTINM